MDFPRSQFKLGQLVATPGALEALRESNQSPWVFVVRHLAGDWGDLDAEDKQLNDQALKDGSRIFSAYHTAKGVKLYVITEAEPRSSTCILRPEKY